MIKETQRPTTETRRTTNAWCRWLDQLIHDDHLGYWVAFTLTTRYSLTDLEKKMTDRCQLIDGKQPTDSDQRQRINGLCAYMLPAVSAAKHRHIHGLLRIPHATCPPITDWVTVTISESSHPLEIRVPSILQRLLWAKPTAETSTFGNLHLRHRDGAVELLTQKTADSVLSYWNQSRDGEHRNFDEGVFAPWRMMGALRIRQGREPRIVIQPPVRRWQPSEPRQSVEEFLALGGHITVVPPVTDVVRA